MRTKRLKLPTAVSKEDQEALARRFPTVEGFLLEQARAGHRHAAPQGPCSEAAVEALSEFVAANVAPRVLSGPDLLEIISTKTRLLPTGCASLDQILRGGLREGQITELAGSSATGKTQLCLWIALSAALRGERSAYVDAAGSFSVERLAEMHRHAPQEDKPPLTEALECISVHRVHNAQQALAAIAAVDHDLRRAADSEPPDDTQPGLALGEDGPRDGAVAAGAGPRVLLLDSLPYLISPVLGGRQTQGHALMSSLAAAFHRIAGQHGAAVVVTNSLVQASFDGGRQQRPGERGGGGLRMKPALGEHWRRQPHCRLTLLPGEDGGGRRRRAILSATTLGPAGEEAVFELWEGGVRDVSEAERLRGQLAH